VKSPLRWLLEEGSHTERVEYHLGRAPPEVGLKRANRLEVLLRSARRRLPSPDKWPYQLGLRAVPNTLPQVLCIGAQKAGTTWLYENLARHPEVFVPPEVKEVHYFDFLFHHPLADYAEVFAAGRGQVRCDITPNYGRLRAERIRFCHRVMPDARLIFLMRNPVERAWSQAVMDLAKRSNRRFEDVPAEDFQKHFRSPSIRGNGGYCDMIDRWLAVYRREQLFVGFFEEVTRDPRALLTRIFRHIGVSEDVRWEDFPLTERIHAGLGAPLPDAYRVSLEEIFAPEIERLARRFGGCESSRLVRPEWLGSSLP